MSVKKKKQAKKSSASVASKGRQVSRPSHKKPRPKKHIEPKLPKLGTVPKSADVIVEPPSERNEEIASKVEKYDLSKFIDELKDVELPPTVKLGGIAPRPALGILRDQYEEYRASGIKGPNPPKPQIPGEIIQLELPVGQTEESLTRLVNIAVSKLKAEHIRNIEAIAALYGEEYKTKGFAEANYKNAERDFPVQTDDVSTEKLGWFTRLRNWFNG